MLAVADCKMKLYEFVVDLHKKCLREFDMSWRTLQLELRVKQGLSAELDYKSKNFVEEKLEVRRRVVDRQHNFVD